MTDKPTPKEIDDLVYELRQAGKDDTYSIASAVLAKWGQPAQEAEPVARLEIESLKAQLHAAKQINAAQFGLLAASIPGSALRASHGQAPATAQADGVPAVDQSVMELAESVGLIGPTSRIYDLHAAIQRFHDLICVNATIKAANMAAEVISSVAMPDLQDAVVLLRKYRRLCQEVGRGDSAHLDRIEAAAVAVQTVAACAPADSVPVDAACKQGASHDR